MEREIAHLKQIRKNILHALEGLTPEQWNKIPEGFNNNIAWNVAHTVVTQQLLQYGLTGLPMITDAETIAAFRKGTSPSFDVTEEQMDRYKKWLEESPVILEVDYKAGKFSSFKEYPTSFGLTLREIGDAVSFNNIHEGLHYGYILALKHAI